MLLVMAYLDVVPRWLDGRHANREVHGRVIGVCIVSPLLSLSLSFLLFLSRFTFPSLSLWDCHLFRFSLILSSLSFKLWQVVSIWFFVQTLSGPFVFFLRLSQKNATKYHKKWLLIREYFCCMLNGQMSLYQLLLPNVTLDQSALLVSHWRSLGFGFRP
jgi:hypothetical protein